MAFAGSSVRLSAKYLAASWQFLIGVPEDRRCVVCIHFHINASPFSYKFWESETHACDNARVSENASLRANVVRML